MCHSAKDAPYDWSCHRHLGWASTWGGPCQELLELTQRCQKDVFPRWNQCTPSSSVVRAAIPWSLPPARCWGRLSQGNLVHRCGLGGPGLSPNWQWIGPFRHIGRTIATGCPSQGSANSLSIFASNALRYWRRLGKGQLSSSI